MLSLKKNSGRCLEPSVGDGAFMQSLNNAVGIELDKSVITDKNVLRQDFFSYSVKNKFDTVIGNPPYVRYRDILANTKKILPMSLFDLRSNLYLFFIYKSILHLNEGGELIFITPRDFIKATSSMGLNEMLYKDGSFTHFYDLGDGNVFDGATPNCAIWRWVKGKKGRKMKTGGSFCFSNGQIWFGDKHSSVLGDYFDVKVGAVSGADAIFTSEKRGNISMVCSTTATDRKTRKMIYNIKDSSLRKHKHTLINRKIKKFNEDNWWQWGRGYHEKEGERIYVNCKTRNKKPFYISEDTAYDGSVLALFPKQTLNISKMCDALNKVHWDRLGFVCGGRHLFTQRSLTAAPVEPH